MFILFGAALFCCGILGGIIVNSRGQKEYNGEVISTLCDEVAELQAITDVSFVNNVVVESPEKQLDLDLVVAEVIARIGDQKFTGTVEVPRSTAKQLRIGEAFMFDNSTAHNLKGNLHTVERVQHKDGFCLRYKTDYGYHYLYINSNGIIDCSGSVRNYCTMTAEEVADLYGMLVDYAYQLEK
jgi:hypothetical protein